MQNEVKVLLALLPKYAAHVNKYPHTLLIRFYGLHRVRPLKGAKVGPASSGACPGLGQNPEECSKPRAGLEKCARW